MDKGITFAAAPFPVISAVYRVHNVNQSDQPVPVALTSANQSDQPVPVALTKAAKPSPPQLLPKTPNMTLKCPMCSRVFHKRHHLDSHLITHSTGKRFQCMVCGKRFRHGSSLARHKRSHNKNQNINE